MSIENTFTAAERAGAKPSQSTDLNHDILSAMNSLPSKLESLSSGIVNSKSTDWLPSVIFYGLPKPTDLAKSTLDRLAVPHAPAGPNDILDDHTITPFENFASKTLKSDSLVKSLSIEEIKKLLLSKDLPSPLAKDPVIKKAVEVIKAEDLKKVQPTDQKNSDFDEYAKKHPEIKKQLEQQLSKTQETQVNTERSRLTNWADRNLHEPDRSKFKKDMADFEKRAHRDGLSNQEIAKTYKEIGRLTTAQGDQPVTALERKQLAQQIMHQAAVPTSIDQGQHKTCNVTTVESRTYSRNPSEAAKLVTDVALTGQYRTADGTIVKVNPKPHHESTQPSVPGGDSRSYASEIFQVTAVNIHYARDNAKTGRDIRYEQIEPAKGDKGDSGERLMDYSKNPPVEVLDSAGKPKRRPGLDDNALPEISNQITRLNENSVLLAADSNVCGSKDGVVTVKSDEELAAKLKWLKEHHQLPAIVRVNTNNEPFYTDSGSGSAGGSGGAHVVTITDYDEKTGRVCIDNSWGEAADHGKDKPVHVHDLFTAMHTNNGAEDRLKRDVNWNRDHNIQDPMKEMELLRMQKANNKISDAEYQKGVERFMEQTKKRWDNGANEADRTRDIKEINNLIRVLPPKDQLQLMRKEHNVGLINDQKYAQEVETAGWKIGRDYKRNTGKPGAEKDYQKGQEELKKALSDLPPAKQKEILEYIEWSIKKYP